MYFLLNFKKHLTCSLFTDTITLVIFICELIFRLCFPGRIYIVRQNLEKNIEKVVAVTLSLGMVAINTCSNSNYSNKTVFSSNFKNENIVYATELSESEKMVPTPAPEKPVEIKNLSKKIDKKVSKSNEKKKINSLSVVPVKHVHVDLEKKEDVIEEAPASENTVESEQWDRLLADYEKYEQQIPDPVDPVGDIDKPTQSEESERPQHTEKPEVTGQEITDPEQHQDSVEKPQQPDTPNSSEKPLRPIHTEPEVKEPLVEKKEKLDETPEEVKKLTETVIPTIVKTPFGNHLELVKKSDTTESLTPVNDLTEVQNQQPKEKESDSPPETPIEILPERPEMTITVYDEKQAFLDSIPEEGINGYSKATIITLITLGLPVVSIAALVGLPWLYHKFN